MSSDEFTVIKIKHSGGYQISTIHGGYRIVRIYYGYTKRESISKFRKELKTL